MKFVETKYFHSQIQTLKKLYPNVEIDYQNFKNTFNPEFAICLFGNMYKERRMNTSIPTGKRWWFRFIVFVEKETAVPILIYSKKEHETVMKDEIKEALKRSFEELS